MRWKCTVAYDGTEFEGWQSQVSGHTIQDFIERRLSTIFEQPIRIHGSGRTDSGVHARAQVFHFDGEWPHGAAKLLRALRVGYPSTIQVYRAEVVAPDFHARFSATGKCYHYRLFEGDADPFGFRYCWSLGNRRLDVEAMNVAATRLIGTHDFSAFAANRGDDREDNPVKELRRLDVTRDGPHLSLVTEGSGYLYKMVRSLTGALVEVGLGKLTAEELEGILHRRTRTHRIQTAPAEGLCLERVDYPEMIQ